MTIRLVTKDGHVFHAGIAENTVKEFITNTAEIGKVLFADENTYISMDYIGYIEKIN